MAVTLDVSHVAFSYSLFSAGINSKEDQKFKLNGNPPQ